MGKWGSKAYEESRHQGSVEMCAGKWGDGKRKGEGERVKGGEGDRESTGVLRGYCTSQFPFPGAAGLYLITT
jgi:hypothetical protein